MESMQRKFTIYNTLNKLKILSAVSYNLPVSTRLGSVVFIAKSHLKYSISSVHYMHKVNISVTKKNLRKIFYKST